VSAVGRPGRSYDVPGVASYVAEAELARVLPEVSALVLACPLTEQTRGLIGARELAALPRGAVVVNLSRGQVIDEDALAGALASGHLGGACLDVFATEPLPESSPLWGLDNVIISPHSASTATAENELITELFCDNLRRWLDGAPLRNVYDRASGY
jgi:phosphoglycerate dehydrogenase-like enzyme